MKCEMSCLGLELIVMYVYRFGEGIDTKRRGKNTVVDNKSLGNNIGVFIKNSIRNAITS